RQKSAQMLLQRIGERANPAAVIVTGDFNCGESSGGILLMKNEKVMVAAGGASQPPPLARPTSARLPDFVDSFRVAHPKEYPAGTFNDFVGKKDGDKIDYILLPAPPGSTVVNAEILRSDPGGRYPSDHFPVR